ncbi:S-layer protein [Chroogloeocystis siderophila]|jgi:hypothetical protein|uniref:S-layer protein n=1 Tax=Chroogloeocystis siderophila 5.2 s.c.1 TaxID=247279 RepID=A0A1U7HVS2_9CHRO|nr:S-layer protein [Chroogloeocystis siderophila]OKH27643.1 S-layer protein [Chroogloeocystis siderophila 5.2 s.c.1]
MNLRILATTIFLSTASLVTPVKAQTPATAPTVPISNPVANACIQNQAETLPVPFSDVSPDHWAFKAVMTMYYCGAFRQAAPPSLFQQATPTQSQQSNPTEGTIEFTAPVAPNS